jgi:hypothetical protein
MSNIKHGRIRKVTVIVVGNVPSIQSFTVCDCMCINLPLPGTDSLYVIWGTYMCPLAPYVRLAMDRHYNCVNRPSNCVEKGTAACSTVDLLREFEHYGEQPTATLFEVMG